MEIRNLEDKNIIENFLKTQKIKSGLFLQSYLWGEFQKKYGYKIWRLGFFDRDELWGVALVIKHSLPFGKSYFYCPKGPVLEFGSEKLEVGNEMFNLFFEKLKEISRKEKAIFFRFEPPVDATEFKELKDKIQVKKTPPVQPESTWLIDLRKTEEEILYQMKQKTRYNIHLAEKKKVQVKVTVDLKIIEPFFQLVEKTAKRNKINPHPEAYYLKMLEVFSQENLIKFYLAEYNQKIIAANLVLSYGKTVYYLHGGSSYEYRNVMAPYLLHWRAIQEAKRQGMDYYDFGGVSSEDELNHKWSGISRFKKGFGGFQIDSTGTYDLIFDPNWYYLYRIVKKIRNRLQ